MALESKPGKAITDDDDDEDDDEELVGRKGNPSLRQMMVKVDGGSYGRNFQEQNASTPRSKHSETEQRRRSKINDRFRMLRDLLPCNDQRRDKASLLLEAIEYVQLLQGKVHNYESAYPGWNQDNSKLAPWKINQSPREIMADPSHVTKKVFVSNDISFPDVSPVRGATAFATNSQVMEEHENVCSGLPSKSPSVSFTMPLPAGGSGENSQFGQRLIPDSENMPRQEVQWPRPVESSMSSDILSGEEEMAIDDGTISLSSKYSEGLLATLTKGLRSSGVDLSQANISVQISLGRQAINRPQSNHKDRDGEAQGRANKRRRR